MKKPQLENRELRLLESLVSSFTTNSLVSVSYKSAAHEQGTLCCVGSSMFGVWVEELSTEP